MLDAFFDEELNQARQRGEQRGAAEAGSLRTDVAPVGFSGGVERAHSEGRLGEDVNVPQAGAEGVFTSLPGTEAGLEAYAEEGKGKGAVALTVGEDVSGYSDFRTAVDSSKPTLERLKAGAVGTVKVVLAVAGARRLARRFVGRKAVPGVPADAYDEAAWDAYHRSRPDEMRSLGAAGSGAPASKPKPPPRWRQYELKHGGRQTPMETTFRGEKIQVRLDKPPSKAQIVDFKDYDWSSPAYEKTFIQKKVRAEFTEQTRSIKPSDRTSTCSSRVSRRIG